MAVTWLDSPGSTLGSPSDAVDFAVDAVDGATILATLYDGSEEPIYRRGGFYERLYAGSTFTPDGLGGGTFSIRRVGGWSAPSFGPSGVTIHVEQGGASVSGPPGPTGPTGPAGTPGTNGTVGATGPTGPTGPAGAGAAGATGPAGATGATGPAGEGASPGPVIVECIANFTSGTVYTEGANYSAGTIDSALATYPRTTRFRNRMECAGAANSVAVLAFSRAISPKAGAKVSYRLGAALLPCGYVFAGIGFLNGARPAAADPSTLSPLSIGIFTATGTGNWRFVVRSSGGVVVTDLGAAFAINDRDMLDVEIELDPLIGNQRWRVRNLWSGADTGVVELTGTARVPYADGSSPGISSSADACCVYLSRGPANLPTVVEYEYLRAQLGSV